VLFNFTLEGNLASQPRLAYSKSGHPVCVVRVLHNSRFRDAAGKWVDGRTVSVDLVCWRDLAERVAGLNKGDTIIAEVADDLYIDTTGRYPALQATARTVAVSMRWHPATSHRGAPQPQDGDPRVDEVPTTGGYSTGATERPGDHQSSPGDPVAA
jgi:single-strand DNA-binding protein